MPKTLLCTIDLALLAKNKENHELRTITFIYFLAHLEVPVWDYFFTVIEVMQNTLGDSSTAYAPTALQEQS